MPGETNFKQMLKKMVRIKHFIIFCLILLLIWWGGTAILKYWSQPLTTDTINIFGDNEKGIQFPLITMCDWDIVTKNTLMKDCYTREYDFIGSFVSCMKQNKSFSVESFMASLQLDIRKIVARVQVWTGSEYISLQNLEGQAWSSIFHYEFGFCHSFDLSKINKFEYIPYRERMRPGLGIVMADNNPWQSSAIMVHTKVDLPDALILNGFKVVRFANTAKHSHFFNLKKNPRKRCQQSLP